MNAPKTTPVKTLVLYHKNCQDGFVASYLACMAMDVSTDLQLVAVDYNDPIPDLTGLRVYILDFSFKPQDLIEAAKTAVEVVMLDHHKSAMIDWMKYASPTDSLADEDLPNFVQSCEFDNLVVTFDMEKSGAGMAIDYWAKAIRKNVEHFSKTYKKKIDYTNKFLDNLTQVVNAVEDRDLWKKKIPHTEEICAALSCVPKSYKEYSTFLQDNTIKQIVEKGAGVLQHKRMIACSIASRSCDAEFYGYIIPSVNCNKEFASDVGHILATEGKFSLTYDVMGETTSVSLRSKDDAPDVSVIAKAYNGGGHRNAAGFKISTHRFFTEFFQTL